MTVWRTTTIVSLALCCAVGGAAFRSVAADAPAASSSSGLPAADVAGKWEIQEEDKSYKATLDQEGNGPYTWQDGQIHTLEIADRKWQGTWQQPGNDREGGFELLLSEDGMEAKGVWWYTRVGDRKNIPPRQWGGSYVWKRLGGLPSSSASSP